MRTGCVLHYRLFLLLMTTATLATVLLWCIVNLEYFQVTFKSVQSGNNELTAYKRYTAYNYGYSINLISDDVIPAAVNYDVIKSSSQRTEANTTWLQLRKKLLLATNRTTKVIILSYMRGGSTMFYKMFDNNLTTNSTVGWFEPLDAFYASYFGLPSPNIPLTLLYHENLTRRIPSDNERSELTEFMSRLLNSSFDRLPVDLRASAFFQNSKFFWPVYECIRDNIQPTYGPFIDSCTSKLIDLCSKNKYREPLSLLVDPLCRDVLGSLRSINPSKSDDIESVRQRVESMIGGDVISLQAFVDHYHCMKSVEIPLRSCWSEVKARQSRTTMVVAKLIRWSFVDLEPLIQATPDIHVIHYIRDPRPSAVSRNRTKPILTWRTANWSMADEARALCARMRDDIRLKSNIEARYPGLLLTVRYEDFVLNVSKTVGRVFEYLGREPVEGMVEDIEAGLILRKKRDGSKESAKGVDKWKRYVSYEEGGLMNEYCWDILGEFGYRL